MEQSSSATGEQVDNQLPIKIPFNLNICLPFSEALLAGAASRKDNTGYSQLNILTSKKYISP